ncbi:MAG TPA: hypothetical protein VF817_04470, partial [Patescibacteria group bacterium]
MDLILEKISKFFSENRIKNTIFILVAILLIGAGFRFYHLGSNPLIADEFLDMNSSYGYFKTHIWQAWDFNKNAVNTTDVFAPRDERAWMYKWQVAELFRFMPPTEAAARSVSVLWGLATIVLMYFVAKSFTKNRTIAILAALLFAISMTGIEFDRRLRMYAMFYPMYLSVSWLLFLFFETKYKGSIAWLRKVSEKLDLNILMLIPLLPVAALSFHLQLLSANIVPAFAAYVLIMALWTVWKKKCINKYLIFVALGIVGFVAAKILMPGFVGLMLASIKFFIDNQSYIFSIFRDYSQFLGALLVLVYGIYWLAKREGRTKEALWLGVSFVVPLLMAAFLWKRTQGIQYVFFIQSFLIILMASGIYGIARFFEQQTANAPKKAFALSLAIILLLLPNWGYFSQDNGDNTYHRDNTRVGDYRKVFAYVRKHSDPSQVIITRNFRT